VVPDRAAGFGMNPNITAFVLVLLCAAILDFRVCRPTDGLVLVVTGIGVFLTLSRGGAILFLFEFVCYGAWVMWLNVHRHPMRALRSAGALGALVLVLVIVGALLVDRADMFTLSYQRLDMISGNSGALVDDDGRLEAAEVAWQHVMESPVIGYGTGYSYSLPLEPHNMYLQQWLNNGFPGLLAYLWLLGAAGRTFWKRRYPRGVIFIGVVAINGLFSHNILEERAFLCLLGILLTTSLYERHPAIALPPALPFAST
jgi:O-antigen ligase